MAKFLGIHDRADNLDRAVGDDQAQDVDQAAGRVEAPGTWPAVDLGGPQTHALPAGQAKQSEQKPRHILATVYRMWHAGALVSAVTIEGGAVGE